MTAWEADPKKPAADLMANHESPSSQDKEMQKPFRTAQEAGTSQTAPAIQFNEYPSKILLFGEYGILKGSMALAIPHPAFKGTFQAEPPQANPEDQQFMKESNEHLKMLITRMYEKKENFSFLNLEKLRQDVYTGLWFDSDIPQGYGLGSSGALVAAIFDLYATEANKNRPVPDIRKLLASMEGFFHGTSSGLDPLVSYSRKPVLITEEGNVSFPDVNSICNDPACGLFLVDTGQTSGTNSLVEWYLKQAEDWEFHRAIQEVFHPMIRQAVLSLLADRFQPFEEAFGAIGAFQMQYLYPMIPEHMTSSCERGLSTGEFYLKLCGSGGGGYMLGVTRFPAVTENYFAHQGLDLVWLKSQKTTQATDTTSQKIQ